MLEIGIFGPYGMDHDRNIAFCQDTDVHHIILSAAAVAGKGTDGVPGVDVLKDLARKYAEGGIKLASLTPPRISHQALSDADARKAEMDVIGRIIRGMGEADIPYLHLYLSSDPAPSDPAERERLWAGLVDVYREMADIAEASGVRISTHHFHRPDRLLWNYETMTRLLAEVGSPANGVTFCQGKSEMAGDDLVANIRDYGDNIFMVHIRDVVTRVSGQVSAEVQDRMASYGYLEVALGTGEVDMVGTIRALKQIGYSGQLYPEHFPSIAGDRAIGLAWIIGYIRALDNTVEA